MAAVGPFKESTLLIAVTIVQLQALVQVVDPLLIGLMLTPNRLIPGGPGHLMDTDQRHHFRRRCIELDQELMGFDFEIFNGGHLSSLPHDGAGQSTQH